jgi:hypothetical protein
LFGIPHKDVTNAFKAYKRGVLDAIGIENMEAEGFDLTVEIPLKAHILGFKSAEVPVNWRNREKGEAKLKISENGFVDHQLFQSQKPRTKFISGFNLGILE